MTPDQRRRLATKAKFLRRRLLAEVATIVSAETLSMANSDRMLHVAEQVDRRSIVAGVERIPTGWRVLLQHNVGSVFVIVGNILTPKPSQVGLVGRDDMVK